MERGGKRQIWDDFSGGGRQQKFAFIKTGLGKIMYEGMERGDRGHTLERICTVASRLSQMPYSMRLVNSIYCKNVNFDTVYFGTILRTTIVILW